MTNVTSFFDALSRKTGQGTTELILARARRLQAQREARRPPAPPVGSLRTKYTNWLKIGDAVTAPERFGRQEGRIVAFDVNSVTGHIDMFCVDFGHLKSWQRPQALRPAKAARRMP